MASRRFFAVKLVVFYLAVLAFYTSAQECNQQSFGSDSFVCVCSGSSCDYIGDVPPPADTSSFTIVSSSKDSDRFAVGLGTMDSLQNSGVTITVDPSVRYQTMMGFGGAFTDSTGFNVAKLSAETQESLLRSYFAPEGIRYSLCRVPIAGSDFSTRPYSYDDVPGDVNLDNFALAEEDYLYKLPFMKRALELVSGTSDLKFFGSPWAPPAWMKTNGMANGSGSLLTEMWGPYSNYLVKFISAYEEEGVPIWGITTQNEPMTGFSDWPWNTCAWTAEDQRDWIKTNLGPAFVDAGYDDVKIMVLDHNREFLPDYPAAILEDPETYKYVDGIAVHWYSDNNDYPDRLTSTHDLFPDKFLLYTESCEGWNAAPGNRVELGSWQRAQNYVVNIIDDVTHYSTGWVDWNMALDQEGGPNWVSNFVDSPVIVNAAEDTFYKQPMFYAMGHFSRFVLPGDVAVDRSISDESQIRAATFVKPDGTVVAVILNMAEEVVPVSIQPSVGADFYANLMVPGKSLHTLLFAV
ncbi:lysosomal acid glucosylceramidase [Hyalella azteca]|uniref:Glucosylceramidase n=1 Tax=Hyalella azteca TaxID=294128 RepID=A0A8B7NG62_HYAAZ|nr:lysosomal acid glucosylceramidase [Hyalella azteca]